MTIKTIKIESGVNEIVEYTIAEFITLEPHLKGHFITTLGARILPIMEAIEGDRPKREESFLLFISAHLSNPSFDDCDKVLLELIEYVCYYSDTIKKMSKPLALTESQKMIIAINECVYCLLVVGFYCVNKESAEITETRIRTALHRYLICYMTICEHYSQETTTAEIQGIATHISFLSSINRTKEEIEGLAKGYFKQGKKSNVVDLETHQSNDTKQNIN